MKWLILSLCIIIASGTATAQNDFNKLNDTNPKREFRGAWLHTVFQSQYSKQSTDENKAYLIDQLNKLQEAGVNAVLFQVRPQADALYKSTLEPWSRHLTGKAGVAPSPMWDPLQFMIDECHKRGMELHAWLNPYRVTTSAKETLPKNHIYYSHPEWFVRYGGKLYFDPALPECREFIFKVVDEIISNYDVDAIHMDDYFYPYPVAGEQFPDNESYAKYGNGMKRDDWRRKNVDMLIEGLHNLLIDKKPWVRLGISPFGVWRNKKSDPRGSNTNALQNYDALYADVLLWTEKGWVDYMLPQLYWELEHPKASTEILAHWWDKNTYGRHMYYGQDVRKTMDKHDINGGADDSQLAHKIRLSRELKNVQGNCWWPGYEITANYKGVADSLSTMFQSNIALVPNYPWLDSTPPNAVKKLKIKNETLSWQCDNTKDPLQEQTKFVIYCFYEGTPADINNGDAIIAITPENHFELPEYISGNVAIVVTALDRCNNESEPQKITLRR